MDMTLICINSLKKILNNHFSDRLFSYDGYKEWAFCMENDGDKWLVYQAERGNHYDEVVCYSVLDACLHMIRKATCIASEITILDKEFFAEISGQKIA